MTKNPAPKKLAFARGMRANPTTYEAKVWQRLRSGLREATFVDQVVICGYTLDFYCAKVKLAVELDGVHHDATSDSERDAQLFTQYGVTVLRFTNPTCPAEINAILHSVWAECRWRLARLRRGLSTFPGLSSQPRNKEEAGQSKSKNCGNVENPEGPETPQGCQRQVYTSMEVAENTARSLTKVGITGVAERCEKCGLIHLKESRLK